MLKSRHHIIFAASVLAFVSTLFSGCMDNDPEILPEARPEQGKSLFVLCEGNFQYGNASLSLYDTESGTVNDNVFYAANGQRLGDTAQSMTLHDGTLWIVVNGSHVIFAVDPATVKEKGRVTGESVVSPRYIHFVSDDKAYVTQMYDSRILIVDPKQYAVTGSIDTGMESSSASTEQMVQIGGYVFVNCWSYQKKVLKIDTASDKVTAALEVGVQPASMCSDADGRLWVLTDGGYPGNPVGDEPARLVRIDPESFTVEKEFVFAEDASPSDLQVSEDGRSLYFLDGDIWKMDIGASELPSEPYIVTDASYLYALTVNPATGDIYAADAMDFSQAGVVSRYSPDGKLTDEFNVGVCPGAFCWY